MRFSVAATTVAAAALLVVATAGEARADDGDDLGAGRVQGAPRLMMPLLGWRTLEARLASQGLGPAREARVIDSFGTVEGRCRPYVCLEAAGLDRRHRFENGALAANLVVGAGVLAVATGIWVLAAGRADPLAAVGTFLRSGGTASF